MIRLLVEDAVVGLGRALAFGAIVVLGAAWLFLPDAEVL